MIAEQPTHGIDIGSAEFVHHKLIEMRNAGAGILLVSADLNEVMDLSDRIIAKQFHTMCKPYMEKVTVDDEVFAALPSMKEIATNTSY